MLLVNFLKAILPEEGVKVWTSIKDKQARNHFCTSFEELAEQIMANDALGIDTYHACATFVTPQNRRAANAGWMKCQWADIDIGVSTPERPKYANIPDAIRACYEFCNRVGIPLPGFVRSGTGLHAYWVFDRVLPSGEWLPLAQRFKLLTQTLGFHCDPSRTADSASILRPPGSHNYKIPERPGLVSVVDAASFVPVSYEDYSRAVINYQGATTSQTIKIPAINASLSAGIASKAFDATKGLTEGEGRNNALAKYCGELLAKGVMLEDVVKQCVAWNKLNVPPLDDKEFRTVIASIARKETAKQAPMPIVRQALAASEEILPTLPFGYKWGPAQQLMVKVKVEQGGGTELLEDKVIAQLPVYLASWLNEEGHEVKNSYLLRHLHPQNGWLSVTLTTEELNGKGFYSMLSKKGISLMLGMDKHFLNYIRTEENMLRLPGFEKTQYAQFGWKDTPAGPNTAFLVGNKLCHADGRVEEGVPAPKIAAMMQSMHVAKKGSLADWSQAANRLGTIGLEAHLGMTVASFAAPLMKFCVDDGNGGAILSIISEDSGKGKTPLCSGMASVWGTLQSIRSTGNFTGNRLIDDIVCRCNLPQVQEEMDYCDPEITTSGIRKFTSGSDRGRLDQGGNAKGMPSLFQTLLISISNRSLRGIVELVDKPMAHRVFEIDINDTDPALISNLGGMARAMMDNCGHAGLAFARLIVEPQVNKYIQEHLRGSGDGDNGKDANGSTIMKYRLMLNSGPEHRYIVWTLASIEVAATLLNHYKIMEFDVNRLMSWLVAQAKGYVTHVTGHEEAEDKLEVFIREHINACVTVQGPYDPRAGVCFVNREPSGPRLFMRMDIRNKRLYIANHALKDWCIKQGISFIGMGKKLRSTGIVLDTCKTVTLGAGTNIASGRCACWEIDTAHAQLDSEVVASLVPDPNQKVVPIKGQ